MKLNFNLIVLLRIHRLRPGFVISIHNLQSTPSRTKWVVSAHFVNTVATFVRKSLRFSPDYVQQQPDSPARHDRPYISTHDGTVVCPTRSLTRARSFTVRVHGSGVSFSAEGHKGVTKGASFEEIVHSFAVSRPILFLQIIQKRDVTAHDRRYRSLIARRQTFSGASGNDYG